MKLSGTEMRPKV